MEQAPGREGPSCVAQLACALCWKAAPASGDQWYEALVLELARDITSTLRETSSFKAKAHLGPR